MTQRWVGFGCVVLLLQLPEDRLIQSIPEERTCVVRGVDDTGACGALTDVSRKSQPIDESSVMLPVILRGQYHHKLELDFVITKMQTLANPTLAGLCKVGLVSRDLRPVNL